VQKGLNWAAISLIALAVEAWPACDAADAQPTSRMLEVLPSILEQFAGVLPDGATRWLGDKRAIYQVPVRNPQLAALMERARRADEVVPLTDTLFAAETAAVGLWHAGFFVDNYGTAIVLAAPRREGGIPVVLVPGIGGSPRDFADLVPHLQRAGYRPAYFVYPSGMALGEAAEQLGKRLRELAERHDVDRLVVIGHSMGGVVAKALLDEVDVDDDLPSWRLFISISSPFGGVDTAQYADRLPQHPAAWDDLAPNSAFMRKVQSTPFPSDLRFYLFFGARSSNRLMRALGNNDGVLSIDSMCGSPVTGMAVDVVGFYEDHTSILAAPLVLRRLDGVLNAELGQQAASVFGR
jgi:pimeloyl-ACP methyl ester carboxylesterase